MLPPSTGLTRAYYDNIGSVDTSNAGSISAVETAVETSTATSTSIVTNVAIAAVAVDDAYRYTGYIFLEAGKTYTVSGSRDDTLMVKLGGAQVYGVGYNNWGAFTGTTSRPRPRATTRSRSRPTTATAPATWTSTCRSTAPRPST